MMRTLRSMPRLALTLALSAAASGCGEHHDPAPTVALAEVVRGTMTLERSGASETVRAPARVEDGATVTTADDGRGALTLDTGAWILLDRATSGTASLTQLALARGRVWVDASAAGETTIQTEQGTFTSAGAAFAVALGETGTTIYCGSGEVTYVTPRGEGRIAQGETLVAGGSDAPTVQPEAMWDDWTGGLADPARGRLRGVERVGVLAGRTTSEIGVARTPLPIRGHEVNVAVRGDLALTEVVQTFFNARSDTLEGEWAMRLPADAIVESFAVDTGSGFVDGAMNTIGVSSGYEIAWQPRDSYGSKLTWDGPERLRARIHPVPPGATVRVRVRYTEWLDRRGARRTYVYPMRAEGEPPLLGEFVLTVDTRSASAGDLRAGMGAREESGRVVLRQSDFRPHADFYLDLYDPEGNSAAATSATAYRVDAPTDQATSVQEAEGEHDYVLIDLPTEPLGEEPGQDAVLDLVLLLDVSGATDPEDLEIARAVVEAVLQQLAPTDRVAIRLADVASHPPEGAPEELAAVTPEVREAILESLARVDLGGATDLGQSLRQAAALVSGHPRGAVLYLGDALPTTGGLDATALRATLATLDAPPRFFGLAIGDGANVDLLRALMGEQATAVRDRESASRAVMHLLAEAARPTLRGVSVDLGEGIERVYPRGPITIGVGEHLRLVGRLVDELPTSITVRGSRDGRAFEQALAVTRGTVDDLGDIRRRWATDRLRELLDADAGREAMVELGQRFRLVTPWTALVVGSVDNQIIGLIEGFDHDPLGVAWGLGGGSANVPVTGLTSDELGWRRRMRRPDTTALEATPEATWSPRVDGTPPAAGATATRGSGDGGLGRASVDRALAVGERGPRQCYERRALVRPDLGGDVTVRVQVAGDGAVREANVARSSLSDSDTEQCMLGELRGLRFPAHGGETITVEHTFVFRIPERELGTRRTCSDASRHALEIRRALWRERLSTASGAAGVLTTWRAARAACELSNWRARRTLLDMMLAHVGGVAQQVELYRALAGDTSVATYLRRAILRNVRTPDDVYAVRWGLGLDAGVDWSLFSRMWWQNESPQQRLALVRRWLEVAPDEMDLRLRLLSLLEQTSALPEARRVARELRADPLADARVRTAVGEFWLRQENEPEARRVFSEIVEHAPLDPWARRRLGDLYRAHAWSDDAYREYQTLAHLRPGEGEVLLLLARAAADAGRIDEALRLEQRLSEATEPGVDEGAASYARLWTTVRLARLENAAREDDLRAQIRRRWREAGVLRDPPDVFAALSWSHPDDAPRLLVHWPGIEDASAFEDASLGGAAHGISAVRVREREEGDHLFEVRRDERDALRDVEAELVVIVRPGTTEQRILFQPIRLTREQRRLRFRLGADDQLVAIPVPPEPAAANRSRG
jgi:tetratricopeptide (TPR) repeat protein